jgi:hypothetical protein
MQIGGLGSRFHPYNIHMLPEVVFVKLIVHLQTLHIVLHVGFVHNAIVL